MKLEVQQVTKRYSNKTALQDFSAVFESGIYGLLGPNGAGKSPVIKIIVSLLRPTAGRVTLDDKEVSSLKAEYRRRIGYLPQSVGMYKNFSGRDMMLYFAEAPSSRFIAVFCRSSATQISSVNPKR